MRHFIFVGSLAILLVSVLAGCDQALDAVDGIDAPSVALQADGTPTGLALPAGTLVTEHRNSLDQPVIRFQLPDSHRLIGFQNVEGGEGSEVVVASNGEITCTCVSENGACIPFKASRGGTTVVGCVLDGCTSCTAEASEPGENRPLSDIDVIPVNHDIRIVLTQQEADQLACPTEALFEVDFVREALAEFANRTQRDHVAAARSARTPAEMPEGYVMAPIDLFGRLVQVPVQREMVASALFIRSVLAENEGGERGDELGEEAGSCRCNSGSSGCAYERRRVLGIGSVEYCDPGPCTSCTLITS